MLQLLDGGNPRDPPFKKKVKEKVGLRLSTDARAMQGERRRKKSSLVFMGKKHLGFGFGEVESMKISSAIYGRAC